MDKKQREARETDMFGSPLAVIRESIESSITFQTGGSAAVAMSYLSDAQEMIARRGESEQARRTINVAKWVISEYLMEREDE